MAANTSRHPLAYGLGYATGAALCALWWGWGIIRSRDRSVAVVEQQPTPPTDPPPVKVKAWSHDLLTFVIECTHCGPLGVVDHTLVAPTALNHMAEHGIDVCIRTEGQV